MHARPSFDALHCTVDTELALNGLLKLYSEKDEARRNIIKLLFAPYLPTVIRESGKDFVLRPLASDLTHFGSSTDRDYIVSEVGCSRREVDDLIAMARNALAFTLAEALASLPCRASTQNVAETRQLALQIIALRKQIWQD